MELLGPRLYVHRFPLPNHWQQPSQREVSSKCLLLGSYTGFSEMLQGQQVPVLGSTLLVRWPWEEVDWKVGAGGRDSLELGMPLTEEPISGGQQSPRSASPASAEVGGCLRAFNGFFLTFRLPRIQ